MLFSIALYLPVNDLKASHSVELCVSLLLCLQSLLLSAGNKAQRSPLYNSKSNFTFKGGTLKSQVLSLLCVSFVRDRFMKHWTQKRTNRMEIILTILDKLCWTQWLRLCSFLIDCWDNVPLLSYVWVEIWGKVLLSHLVLISQGSAPGILTIHSHCTGRTAPTNDKERFTLQCCREKNWGSSCSNISLNQTVFLL